MRCTWCEKKMHDEQTCIIVRRSRKARQRSAEISEEYDDAKRDVGKLLEKDEGHKEAKALMLRIKRLEAAQAKKDAKVFGGMFGKLGGLYEEEKTPAAKEEKAPKSPPLRPWLPAPRG